MNSQLPFLIRLLDDPSPVVQARIGQRLREFGPAIHAEIARQQLVLTPLQRDLLARVLRADADDVLKDVWPDWLGRDTDWDRLEGGLTALARWQLGAQHPQLGELLDDLAQEYSHVNGARDAIGLSHFLFQEKGLRGAVAEEYYDPLNSNLVAVLELGRGIPISLTAIFMLAGHRLGIPIYGCNFPGHFLARAAGSAGDDWVFDCFEGGRLLSRAEVATLKKAAPRELSQPAPAPVMIARVLRNLANAFYQNGREDKTRFVIGLLRELEDVEHT
jgi:regulator of sirC expression with transglutaminase-like and TPR domain